MGEFALGQPVSRFEDPRLLRGGGRYVDDMVLPHMVFGHVLRSPHAHARIRSIDTTAAQAAPGVLAVLTGADWEASGWRDLPSASGNRRRDGSPAHRPHFPALVKDRVRWVGDYVAFVVAETRHQAADAAELIDVEYETLAAIVSTEDATKPGTPPVWDEAPDNISFVYLEGDKAATDTAFAGAAHTVKRKFVINRVTAATMEPRGCDRRLRCRARPLHALYGPQRTHATAPTCRNDPAGSREPGARRRRRYRRQLWHEVGDLQRGGAGTLARLEARRAAGQMDRRAREAFLSDDQAATMSPTRSSRSTVTAISSALRVKTICQRRRLSRAPGCTPSSTISATLAGRLPHARDHADVLRASSPTRPDRALSRRRAARGGLRHRAADRRRPRARSGIDRVELRRRNLIPPDAMPFKTGLVFTYDCGEFEKTLDMALELADAAGLETRRTEARRHGKLRGFGLSNTIERAAAGGFEAAEIRFDRSGTVTLMSGSITQGQGHETIYKSSSATGSASTPTRCIICRATPTRCRSATAPAARVRPRLAARRCISRPKRSSPRPRRSPAHARAPKSDDVEFEDGLFSSPRSNRALTVSEIAKELLNPQNLPDGMDLGLIAGATFSCRSRTSPTAAISVSWRSTRRPAPSRSCATASSTMSARL